MIDGTLGNDTGSEYKIELLEVAKPYHAKPVTISKINEGILNAEVIRLIYIDILKQEINPSGSFQLL